MSKVSLQRSLLGKQPARLLMVDLTSPFSVETVEDVCDVLENLYSVACNFSGPSRIPFFSIVMLHDYHKNNFSRIQTAISDMKTTMQDCCNTDRLGVQFEAALHEACCQYQKQLQPTFQSGGISVTLEIVILSNQTDKTIQKQVELAASTLNLEHIKKIQVLCLTNLYGSLEEEMEPSQGSVTSGTSHQSNDSVTGLVEIVKLDPDMMYLQNFFNSWLLDTNTDVEHLHLILPSTDSQGAPTVIKCDLNERVLHPAQLPFYHNFTLHSDSSAMKIVFPSNSKAMGMTVPVYKLKVTGQVPVSTVCDSLVYGMPMIAQATACWKIDWDELEKHQQNFHALCYTLAKKEQALIAHLLPTESSNSGTSSRSRQNKNKSLQPIGNFILLPSCTGSLLIKCLAVSEIVLPYSPICDVQEPAEEQINIMDQILNKVEVLPSYNPLNHTSHLYEYLRSVGQKPAVQRQQKRQMDKTDTCTNKLVTTSNRQTHKQPVVQNSVRETDTPFSNRPIKTYLGNTKRKLYNQNQTMFMEASDDFLEDSTHKLKFSDRQAHSFPTSL